jgi:DNA-binding MarR family transcriptional regulator
MGDVSETAGVPLARLLAMTLRWMVDELHRRLAARGWSGVRPAYGFVLLAVRAGPTTPVELAATLDVSKQAASKVADAMVADGLLTKVVDEHDSRRRRLALSARGEQLLVEVEAVYVELENEWAAIIGETGVAQTRNRLTRVLQAAHGGSLPAIRPSWT